MLVCTGLVLFQVQTIISDYLVQHKVNTVVETIPLNSLDFPDVTVCNAEVDQSLEEFIFDAFFNGSEMNVSD